MIDFTSMATAALMILLQLFPDSLFSKNRLLPHTGTRGVGVVEVFQGKDGVTIHLVP